jgi:hypothetical protein
MVGSPEPEKVEEPMPPNPLRQPKPSRDECLYKGRFYFGSDSARLGSDLGFSLALGRDYLWLSDELSIPLWAIQSTEIFEKGWFPKRRALKIVYENPITGLPEAIVLLKLDFLGFYVMKPLQQLMQQLESARATATRPTAQPISVEMPSLPARPDVCEVCGGKPAYYVGYFYLISALMIAFRGPMKRRVHCRKHNLIYGLGHYLVTATTGWFGIGIFAYPFVVFSSARSLEPSFGRATYLLAILPILVVAGLIVRWW